ncbi:MAG: PAS domain S-box protein [Sulfuritalea sp.]|nr:PAS domain S-box protein [Sulfuritalea sp.]
MDKEKLGAGDTATDQIGVADNEPQYGKTRWIVSMIMIVALVVPVIAASIIAIYRPQIERDAYNSLTVTARLKAQQVEFWLGERRGDGNVVASDLDLVARIAAMASDPTALPVVRARLDAIRNSYGYAAAFLLSPQGKLLLRSGQAHKISAQTLNLLPGAFSSGRTVQSGFYLDTFDHLPGFNFVVPLQRSTANGLQPVAVLVLHIETSASPVLSLIMDASSLSPSSEMLLVERTGDSVMFLNQLRHIAQNTALEFTRPLTEPDLPTAIALRTGGAGTVHGKDYLGRAVLAAYTPVAGTRWQLVAKRDHDEIMAPLWKLPAWIALVAAGAVLAGGVALRRLWSQRERLRRLALRERQEQSLRENEARLRAITETARDAIVTADADGRIVGWNTAATHMFGFDENEIIGQSLEQIIPPRFRKRAMEGFFRMMDGDPDKHDGSVVELTGVDKNGHEFLLERSVALWATRSGHFYTCTMRDITELKKEDDALRIAAAVFESHQGMVVTDANKVILRINHAFTKIHGYTTQEAVGRQISLVKSGQHDVGFYEALWAQVLHKGSWQGEIWNRSKFGEIHPHWLTMSAVKNAHGTVTHYVGTYTDITEQKKIEVGLQQSEEKLRAMTDNVGIVMFLKDLAGRYLHVNRQYETLFHVTNTAIQGKTDYDIFQKDAADKFVENDQVVIQSGQSFEVEEQVPQDDGMHTYNSVKFPVRNVSGEIYAVCGVATDITERKHQEENTRRLLAENETILNNALVGIVYLKQRRIVSCNRRFEELFQYERGELIGESSERLYETKESFEHIGRVAYAAVCEGRNYSTEVLLQHKDGSLFWGALSGRALDPAHPNDGSIWIYADISERRLAEQQTSKMLQAVEQSPASIVITDRNGVIEYVNPSFCRVSGYSRDEALGRTPAILKSEETPGSTYQELWSTILQGRIWRGSLRNRCKNGDLIWEETSISPIFDEDGEITHFVAVKDDVTERKRIEEELEDHQAHLEDLVLQRTAELNEALAAARIADQAKDEFLANITHELRTPLSAVIGFSSLARPFANDTRQRDYLDKVNSAGKTLAGVIDDLLDLSKIAAGHLELEHVVFSLRQVIGRSRSVISYKAQEKGLHLIEKIDDEVPDVLIGDSLRLEQILLNLLSNAVKFTEHGQVELRVGLHALEAGRAGLNIEVKDSGIGMREEEIDRLFQPFTQADASMTRKFGGTGLGLAICKRLTELMDGDISVTSNVGRGSAFRVRLWLKLGNAGDLPAAEVSDIATARLRYEDVRVLVVDDQAFNRDVVEGLLAVTGITPHLAENGQQALDILTGSAESFDLILMDVQMPVMDGLTATRIIRKLEAFASLPIIAMTAHTMAHEREKTIAAGMNDHIGKPFDEAGFYRVLAKWIPPDKQRTDAIAETEPYQESAEVSGLPALNGVDTKAGLALLLGNEARYRHWLNDFAMETPAAVKQIRDALAAGTPEPASMTAHSLKGRTGLLGMKALHGIAGALEMAIEAAAPTSELLLEFERATAAMCSEIRNALGPAPSPLVHSEIPPDARFSGMPPDSVTRLIAHLKTGNSDSDTVAADCLRELENTAWAPRLHQALIDIERFDFAAAEQVLTRSGNDHE